ncbi:MAG TPA: zinc-binding alcohol dehydrogenase family protein [Sphingomicrobium sp.]|jgi:2-desacetyl-2-hydroxyethyl bacteriochlorophyllide A dehydrogenase
MDVVVCAEPGELRLEQRPKPERAEGEVLVRIRRIGVCGTDMHIYCGNQPFLSYPRVMGHELAGEVAEAPAGSGLHPGDPVYIIPYIACGTCVACRKGKENCCSNIGVLGVHRDGGLAEFLNVPQRFVKKAEGITLDQAAMIEFLAIGAHAVRRGSPGKGDKVLVVGAGPIGIAVALFAKLRGAEVTAIDGREDRLAFCRDKIGVDATFAVGPSTRDELELHSGGDFFDLVFDATGSPKAMEAGFAYVAHGGTYVLVSIVPADISFSDPEFHKREMTLMGSRNATAEDFEMVAQAMRDGLVPTAALHTHSADLMNLPETFPGWMEPSAGVIKAIVAC